MRNRYILGFFALFFGALCSHVFAQVPTLLTRLPTANAVAAPRGTAVELNFSQLMSAQAASSAAIKLTSAWRGQLVGVYAGAGTSTISFLPAQPFLPGEPVQVTATSQTTSQVGAALVPTGYAFRAAVKGGMGVFPNPPGSALPNTPTSTIAADVNGDGTPDLLTTINGPSNAGTVNVRLGNGRGGFQVSADVPVGNRPASVVAGDVNHDGQLDLLTANANSNTASVRLGNGRGGFTGTVDVPVGAVPIRVATGDFNADGNLDLLTVSGSTSLVSLRLGDGQGNFTIPTLPLRAEIPVGTTPVGMSVADVNRDGNLDFVTANNSNNGTNVSLSVRLGNGRGAFSNPTDLPLTNDPIDLLLVDVTGDGNLDLLMPNAGHYHALGTVSVRIGDGHGTFTGGVEVSVGCDPVQVVVGDFNGDRRLDLLTANRNFNYPSGTVSLRLGNGLGAFMGVTDIEVGPGTAGVAVADVNHDGRQDMLATSFLPSYTGGQSSDIMVTVRLGDNRGSFEGFAQISVGNSNGLRVGLSGVAVGDVNNDGNLDLLAPNPAGTVNVRLGNGNGLFTAGQSVPVGLGAGSIAVGDINDDGRLDLLTSNGGSATGSNNTISIRLGDGLGGFAGTTDLPVGHGPIRVVVGDINNDGHLDLVTANFTGQTASVRLGDGHGNFLGTTEVIMSGRISSVALGDVNGDGQLDLLATDYDNNKVCIRLGNGQGNFFGTTSANVGTGGPISGGAPIDMALADVNNDDVLDIITANYPNTSAPTGTASVRLGNGQGGFTGTTEVATSASAQRVAVGDIDGDGKLDLLVSNNLLNTANIYIGNGLGGFSSGAIVPTGNYPLTIALGDMDNDGDLDILVACSLDGAVSLRLNSGLGTSLATFQPGKGAAPERMTLFPNPANKSVTLLYAPSNVPAELFDAQGRLLRRFAPSALLDVSALSTGLYLIRVGNQVSHLVIE